MKKNIKRKQVKGFTLVELLAVIVILAIILVIAVPKIMNTIKDATKASLESSAKMVASQVENQYTVAQTLGKEFGDTGNCMEEWAGLNETDYASCRYEITSSGEAKVTIGGKGKFKGLSVCNATRSTATAIEGECKIETLVTHIQGLYANETTRTSNGLTKDNTSDANIRYAGSNNAVKNYVEFGNTNELWRIIGTFEVETASGSTEELVKIIREDSIGNIPWDTSESTINGDFGINQWGESGSYEGADLMQLLNGKYLNKQNVEESCYNWTTAEFETCNFSSTGMSSTYKNMIETVVWNTGALNWDDPLLYDPDTEILNPVNWYNAERGNITGKICTQGESDCNDTVTRTTTWEGLVALPYITDWSYASSESGCRSNLDDGIDWDNEDFTNATCRKNNWMHYGSFFTEEERTWMLSPRAGSDNADNVWSVFGDGSVGANLGLAPERTRPTLYLKSNMVVYGGDGSRVKPYSLVEKEDYSVYVPTPSSCFEFDATIGRIKGYDISCGTDVVIPSQINGADVKDIGSGAFYNLGITSIYLPNSIEDISSYAFANNSISTVNIPSSVIYVFDGAFEG